MFRQNFQHTKTPSSLMQYSVSGVLALGVHTLYGWATFVRAMTILTLMASLSVESKPPTPVGSCWMEVGANGRCRGILTLNVTWEACCSDGNPVRGWTHHTHISSGQHFLWEHLQGGAPGCQRCKASCEGVRCGAGEACRMRQGAPRCLCEAQCRHEPHLRHSGPKCGSDGRTYNNMCSLLRHNCRRQRHVTVNYRGTCQARCATVTCDANKHCVHDQQGAPQCVQCGQPCRHVMRHAHQRICGTDGRSYNSFCHLKHASCTHTGTIAMAYRGACIDGATCETIGCQFHETCMVRPATLRPQCVSCTRDCTTAVYGRLPVCGSDGRSYNNWCELRRRMCRQGVVIITEHGGRCGALRDQTFPEVDYDNSANESA